MPKIDYQPIRDAIKLEMKDKGIAQKEVAEKLEINASWVSAALSEKQGDRYRNVLLDIAEFLGYTVTLKLKKRNKTD